jgi:hypothetical protein
LVPVVVVIMIAAGGGWTPAGGTPPVIVTVMSGMGRPEKAFVIVPDKLLNAKKWK